MMRYKVGDKVKISENLKLGQTFNRFCITREMYGLRGKVAHITSVKERDGSYCIDILPDLCWTDEMFE